MQHQDPLPQLLSRAADRFLDIITDHGNHTAEVYQDYGSQIISWAADFISLNSVDSIEKERSQDYGSQIISWAADFIDLNSVPATEEERSDAYQHYRMYHMLSPGLQTSSVSTAFPALRKSVQKTLDQQTSVKQGSF